MTDNIMTDNTMTTMTDNTMTDNTIKEMPTYDRAIHNMKNKTTNTLREAKIDIESWKTLMKNVQRTRYKMSDLKM